MAGFRSIIDRLLGRGAPAEGPSARRLDIETSAEPAGNLEQALPTLGAILRAWGENAFETDLPARAARERFGAWADHVEQGTAPPDRPGTPRSRVLRDWAGLRAFAGTRRRAEKDHDEASARELRETLWTFIQRLENGFSADRRSDTRMDGQLRRLRAAVDDPSIEVLRREVLGSVDELRRLAEERAARQRKDLEASLSELTALRQELARARREASIDPLTQLYNRGSFDEQATTLAALRPLTGSPSTLLMVDVDHFKAVNDEHGHPIGDEVLRRLADCMVRTLPRRTDFVARYGGEEFAAILERDGADGARLLAAKLLAAVRNLSITAGGKEIRPTVSIGLAELAEGETAVEWVQRADRALYEAKRTGRNRVVEAEPVLPVGAGDARRG